MRSTSRLAAVRHWLWPAAACFGLVSVITYPQLRVFTRGIPSEADAYFNIWRLAWVAHQLPLHPLHLFDANIFYPELHTLAYSDALLGPGVFVAPLFWAGMNPVLVYNLTLFAGFALSGVTAYLLVEDLTKDRTAALISGALFAASPYRFGHYVHLELQLTIFLPLALWALHRTITTRRWAYALIAGASIAMETYCSVYYGVFLATFCGVVAPLAVMLQETRGESARVLGLLAASGILAMLLVLPYALPYVSARSTVGARSDWEVAYYSATPGDYLSAPPASVLYAERLRPAREDRHLFLGLAVMALAGIALWPPISRTAVVYLIAAAFAFDASLGANGWVFPVLRRWIPAYQGLRVPARFGMFVVFALAVLAGIGAARLSRHARSGVRVLLVAVVFSMIAAEGRMSATFTSPRTTPAVVDRWLRQQPRSPIVELPLPSRDQPFDVIEGRHIYDSLFHWQPLLNGTSGFFPARYLELLERMGTFPDTSSIEYLKSRGVRYIVARQDLFAPDAYVRLRHALSSQSALRFVGSFPETNGESLVYEVPR